MVIMGFLTKDEVMRWSQKYDKEEDLYNTGLEQELGDKLRRTKELTKDELGPVSYTHLTLPTNREV